MLLKNPPLLAAPPAALAAPPPPAAAPAALPKLLAIPPAAPAAFFSEPVRPLTFLVKFFITPPLPFIFFRNLAESFTNERPCITPIAIVRNLIAFVNSGIAVATLSIASFIPVNASGDMDFISWSCIFICPSRNFSSAV